MRVLVLGGTVFVSAAVAAEAASRGHDVTCAARGQSGGVPDGARLVTLDRTEPDFSALEQDWDAVVDIARQPSWVRTALDALGDRTAHWTFVSSINAYADDSIPRGRPGTLRLREPDPEDAEETSAEIYGAHKVACEQEVQRRARAALVLRPGLIAGPGDPTGRYPYWVERLARGGEALAPDSPDRSAQLIDVRDLAAWVVDCAEAGRTGVFDGVAPAIRLGELLEATARGVGTDAELTWVPQEFLVEHGVERWAGARSLPLYLPLPEYAGLMAHDATPSLDAGLRIRPIEDTARDTLAWLRAHPEATRTGLTAPEEAEVLAAWHTIRA